MLLLLLLQLLLLLPLLFSSIIVIVAATCAIAVIIVLFFLSSACVYMSVWCEHVLVYVFMCLLPTLGPATRLHFHGQESQCRTPGLDGEEQAPLTRRRPITGTISKALHQTKGVYTCEHIGSYQRCAHLWAHRQLLKVCTLVGT